MNSKENFEVEFKKKLEKMTSFPARIKFSLFKERETGKLSILTSTIGGYLSKKKIENIKFIECQSILLQGNSVTLHIGDYDKAESVIQMVNQLHEVWCKEVEKGMTA